MVNTNVQSAIPLAGPGARYRMGGNYGPGEYRSFQNVTVTPSGSIRSRRRYTGFKTGPFGSRVAFVSPTYGYPASSDNRYKLDAPVVSVIGELESYPIAIIGDNQYLMNYTGEATMRLMWSPTTSLPANEYLVGAFTYNGKDYWLTGGYGAAYNLYSKAITGNFNTDLIVSWTYADISASKVGIFTPDVAGEFRNFFLHKERLWVVTSTGIYFSAATDPTKFGTVDGGGFVKLQGKTINHAFAFGDSIFISTDRSVEVFTFSADPDEDGYVRNISSQKAVWGVVLNSMPYIISNKALYTVANGTLEMVVDLNEVNSSSYNLTKVRPLGGDSLILLTGTNLYAWVFDTRTGAIHYHSIDGDRQNDPNLASYTNPSASTPLDAVDFYDPTSMNYDPMTYLLLEKQVYGASNQWAVTSYSMNHVWGKTDSADDQCVMLSASNLDWRPINISIQKRNIEPDGNKYFKKKFRFLEFMATIPWQNLTVKIAYDGHAWTDVSALVGLDTSPAEDDAGSYTNEHKAPYTFRIPMNQRASSISLKFETTDSKKAASTSYQNFELIDARYFWTYTGRPNTRKNNVNIPS